MKYGLLFGAAIALYIAHAGTAHSAELILNDGTRIEILEDEKVYISTRKLFSRKGNAEDGYSYKRAKPVALGDVPVVEPEPEPEPRCSAENIEICQFGSTEYCTYFFDSYDGGITFDYTSAIRSCDTNGDNEYTFCGDYVPFQNGYTFRDQAFVRYCAQNPDFNPVQGR